MRTSIEARTVSNASLTKPISRFLLSTAFLAAAFHAAHAGTDASPAPEIGSPVANFSAKDVLGTQHSLAGVGDDKLVVLAFLGVECPLAKLYAPELVKLHAEFASKGVAFFGVDANRQDSVTEIAAFARRHEIPFPILKDLQQQVADRVGATRTPQIVVLDRDRRIRYRGRIDDQFGFIADKNNSNYQKPKADRRDLAEALNELVAGKPVSVATTEPYGCLIGRDREADADSQVTYSNQIARILNDNCVFCHRDGQIAPFALTDYDEVAGWADMIDEVVLGERMPPWHADSRYGHFENDARLSQQDKDLIHQWAVAGAPQGDSKDLPAPPKFAEGWMIPEPDEVIKMADKPYKVPATGVVEYQNFVVDPGWNEDKWIAAIEARPGNPSVVHHILLFVMPPGGRDGHVGGDNDYIGAFAPGLRPELLPEGMARFVPAGSKFIFQLHYTPNGSPQEDVSYAGFLFADPEKVKKEVVVSSAINFAFEIPPGADHHQVTSRYVFTRDSLLLTFMPHMHLRGKAFQYEAVYPDGKREMLLSVPRYDFGWQTNYRLAKPKLMPRGTRLECTAWFDNSEENLNNPDPTRKVGFGDQTWDEMMIGFFEATPAAQDLTDPARKAEELSRVEKFLVILQATEGKPDANMEAGIYLALTDPEWMGRFREIIAMAAPQIDRVCVSTVVDGKLTPFRGAKPADRQKDRSDAEHESQQNERERAQDGKKPRITIRSPLPQFDAADEPLAGYLGKPEPIVHNDLSQLEGALFREMTSRGARSSLHVPVTLKGQPLVINFWSTDASAFPKPAVDFLTAIAHGMADVHNKQGREQAAAR